MNSPGEITKEQRLINAMKAAIREYLTQPQLQPQPAPPSQVVGVLMARLYFTFCMEMGLPRPTALDMMIEGFLLAGGTPQQQQVKPPLIVPH